MRYPRFWAGFLLYVCSVCTGTKVQQYLISLRKRKNAELRTKVSTYLRHANSYNNEFAPNPAIPTPTVKDVENMEFGDPFLDSGSLTHPNEPWAVDPDTQEGIQAYLTILRCKEELRRVSKEGRQIVNWALMFQSRLDNLAKDIDDGSESFIIPSSTTPCHNLANLVTHQTSLGKVGNIDGDDAGATSQPFPPGVPALASLEQTHHIIVAAIFIC